MARTDFRAAAARRLSEERELSPAIISLLTTRNTPSGFATSAAMTMFAMFVFGSKAFCNYYYFVIGAMCIAIAAFAGPEEKEILTG